MSTDTHTSPCSFPTEFNVVQEMDTRVLEEALWEYSRGTMRAPIREVVQLALEKWGYPYTVGAAKAILLQTGRYELDMDWETGRETIRPRTGD